MTQLKDNMSDIKKIRQEIERLKEEYNEQVSARLISESLVSMGKVEALNKVLAFIDSLPEDASCVYDTNKLTPTPSVNIEDVARVQFASHAKVFDRKRKAVFDWEQFKEVASIFYGFGKKNSLPEEKPSEDLEEAAKEYATTHLRNNEFPTADSAFIAGAEWQKAKDEEETADLFTIVALDAGQRAREELMKEAVEGEIGYWNQRGLSIRLDQSLKKLGYDMDTKVKIIIVKQ